MPQIIIGIDIAKLKFDVARLCEGQYKHAKFANNANGFTDFIAWPNRFADADVRLCMDDCMDAGGRATQEQLPRPPALMAYRWPNS